MIDTFGMDYLHEDLRWIREALLSKLDGLVEYDVRSPLPARLGDHGLDDRAAPHRRHRPRAVMEPPVGFRARRRQSRCPTASPRLP